MSWYVEGEVAKTRLHEDLPEPSFADGDEVRQPQEDQFFRAMAAAKELIAAVGRDDVKVKVRMEGHAGPHHNGSENILVSVSVVEETPSDKSEASEPKKVEPEKAPAKKVDTSMKKATKK